MKNPNVIEVSVGCLSSLSFVAQKPYLSMNSAILSHKIKEDKEASSFKLTKVCGLPMDGPRFTLSQNSLAILSSPRAW